MPPRRFIWIPAAVCALTVGGSGSPAAAQHDCASATPIAGLPFTNVIDTSTAPTSSPTGSCNAAAAVTADTLDNALWYGMSPPQDMHVRIIVTAEGYDAVATLWTGSTCDDLTEVACRDQPEPIALHATLEGGQMYWLSVGDFGVVPGGGPTMVQLEFDPDPLLNDTCTGAIEIDAMPFAAAFDTARANATSPAGRCNSGAARQAGTLENSVWYTLTPDTTIELNMSVQTDELWDPLLLLLRGEECDSLVEAACQDENIPGEGESLRWTLMEGETYWLVIGDRGTLPAGGEGMLTIVRPSGACCLPDDSCAMMAGAGCVAAGGLFQGVDSQCAAASYAPAGPGANCEPLEDISLTGTALSLGEDEGVVIPIGFELSFFGELQSEIGISANGYLCFGNVLDDFSNDPIPSDAAPNDLIAPLWTDLSPQLGGSVHYETRGVAGADQRLIVQWTDVPRFEQQDANTFQAVLYETGRIDFRYGTITPEPFPRAYTIGVESVDGLTGYSVDAADVGAGMTCVSFQPEAIGVSCAQMCPCEFDGLPDVDVYDLLAYLEAWFLQMPRADVDGLPGVDVFDLLVMLDCWFDASRGEPCP